MDMEKLILQPKRPKGEDGFKIFSIRIPDELVEKINDLAAKSNYSRNELIGKLLEFAVERCDIEENK
jgi:predicted transcriptional regulator